MASCCRFEDNLERFTIFNEEEIHEKNQDFPPLHQLVTHWTLIQIMFYPGNLPPLLISSAQSPTSSLQWYWWGLEEIYRAEGWLFRMGVMRLSICFSRLSVSSMVGPSQSFFSIQAFLVLLPISFFGCLQSVICNHSTQTSGWVCLELSWQPH